MWTTCCRRLRAWCMLSGSCVVTAFHPLHCTTCSAQQSSPRSRTVHQRGPVLCSAADRARLDSFLNCCKRLGFCNKVLPSATELFSDADDALFERINTNSQHVLQRYLPDRPDPHFLIDTRTVINVYLRIHFCTQALYFIYYCMFGCVWQLLINEHACVVLTETNNSRPKGPFIATQLNSTRRRVELSWVVSL